MKLSTPSLCSRASLRRRGALGFTMMEMMISVGITSLLFGMVVKFQYESMNSMAISTDKAIINKDMRQLTSQMSDDARYSNFFVLYSAYAVASRSTASQELSQANSGDFLVFVFYGSPPAGGKFNVSPVSEIVGYYRAPYQANQTSLDPITDQPTSLGLEPVRRFDLSVANGTLAASQYLESTNVPTGGTSTTIEALLPNDSQTTIDGHTIVVQLAQGMADGCLFHNFWGKSIMINGQIVQGNNYVSTQDTYNFTISPRG
jgi:Tfp pilus assembly protein PilW